MQAEFVVSSRLRIARKVKQRRPTILALQTYSSACSTRILLPAVNPLSAIARETSGCPKLCSRTLSSSMCLFSSWNNQFINYTPLNLQPKSTHPWKYLCDCSRKYSINVYHALYKCFHNLQIVKVLLETCIHFFPCECVRHFAFVYWIPRWTVPPW